MPQELLIPVIAGTITMFAGVILSIKLAGSPNATTLSGKQKAGALHGSAHWANWRDIKKAELHKKQGVVVGGYKRFLFSRTRFLKHDGPEHILAFAPTRTGKGVSLIIPTLLEWRYSALILDIKGENYALTAGYRASLGHKVIRFEPAAQDGLGFSYNPLAEVGFGHDSEVADIQNIAAMIVDSGGQSAGKDQFWTQSAAEFLTAGILHVAYRIRRNEGRTANMADIRRFLAGATEIDFEDDDAAKKALDNMFREWIEFDHGREVVNQEVTLLATKMVGMAHQTRTGIIGNAMHALSIFADPYIAANTKHSDFKISDLMNGEQPTSLYLVISPKDIDRLKPIVRIFITQLLSNLMQEMPFENGQQVKPKQRLLLMMDEFPAFGKIDKYEEMLGYMAGYGIKSYVIVQDITQLKKAYGENQSFFSNSSVRIAFAPNEQKTAKLISDLLGVTTILQRKRSKSVQQGQFTGNISDNLQETSRPLLTADEVMRIKLMEKGWFGKVKAGDVLIFAAGSAPIFGRQKLFFQDKILVRRTRIAPPQKPATKIKTESPFESDEARNAHVHQVLFTTQKPGPMPSELCG